MAEIKYTEEMTEELVSAYKEAKDQDARSEVVSFYADKFHKPKNSIIAKLSKEKVYVAITRKSKVTGRIPETKERLVRRLEAQEGFKEGRLDGLEKAPKLVILRLLGEKD